MKKNVFGRQFKRDANERKALFKGLMTELVVHERIQTTEQKARAIRGQVEKLVTKAKNKGAAAERLLLPYLPEAATKKVIDVLGPRFANRPGGYTRMVRLGRRFNDDAMMVVLEWVEKSEKSTVESKKKKSDKKVAEVAEIKEAEVVTTAPKKEEKKARSTSSGQAKKSAAKKAKEETK